ncbi:MAG TPA: DNA mismatch repair endonuclease MutL [Methylomirabilota bacterium]|nr:DNA mismatch repair endonuclease MutL [Methylomirabilota bacterium]
MPIYILSPTLQQRIAAGEVVERPASVVKELIENALDATANTIRVEVQEGGRRLIRVTDDGAGLIATDAPLAFERFATSKISSETDLAAVRTFGFRGEALPSIASVARVRLLSRRREDLFGTEVRVEGGRLVSVQEAGAPIGTTIEVWDLFYNTPARRQFLRSLRTEYGHIIGVFTRFALAFPEKSFFLSFDGREVYAFPASSVQERIAACFGREAASVLEEFEDTGIAGRVWGFVLSTEEVWRRRYYFFVNRRPVRNRILYRAVRETLQGEGGMAFVFVELPPSQVDVNMHPAKTEVRFRDDGAVYELVRGALLRRSRPPWLQIDRVTEPQAVYPAAAAGGFTLIGQVENTFLLTLAEGHLYLLDQHAAEERVFYERLQQKRVHSRQLVAPQVVSLAAEERVFFTTLAEELTACGFVIDPFGPHVVAVRAVPDFVDPREAGVLLSRLLVRVRGGKEDMVQALACLGAVKAGQTLTREGQERLLTSWVQTANPHACAHNRPVYFRLSLDEVRRKVGRTGLSCEFDGQGG